MHFALLILNNLGCYYDGALIDWISDEWEWINGELAGMNK